MFVSYQSLELSTTRSRITAVLRPLFAGIPPAERWAENLPLKPCKTGLSGVILEASVPTVYALVL